MPVPQTATKCTRIVPVLSASHRDRTKSSRQRQKQSRGRSRAEAEAEITGSREEREDREGADGGARRSGRPPRYACDNHPEILASQSSRSSRLPVLCSGGSLGAADDVEPELGLHDRAHLAHLQLEGGVRE